MRMKEAAAVFFAFLALLLGGQVIYQAGSDPIVRLVGGLLCAAGLTYFWMRLRKPN